MNNNDSFLIPNGLIIKTNLSACPSVCVSEAEFQT
jgi:hypothetical protein